MFSGGIKKQHRAVMDEIRFMLGPKLGGDLWIVITIITWYIQTEMNLLYNYGNAIFSKD